MRKDGDISVHKGEQPSDVLFDKPCGWARIDDPDGECVRIEFEAGGRVLVFTNKPLLFVEPEIQ